MNSEVSCWCRRPFGWAQGQDFRSRHGGEARAKFSILVPCRCYQQRRTRRDNQTPINNSSVRLPDPYPDCKQATLQTSSKNDSRVWGGVGY
jgi:hypothetical protein